MTQGVVCETRNGKSMWVWCVCVCCVLRVVLILILLFFPLQPPVSCPEPVACLCVCCVLYLYFSWESNMTVAETELTLKKHRYKR